MARGSRTAEQPTDTGDLTEQPTMDGEQPTPDGEATELTAAQIAEAAEIAKVEGFSVAESDFRTATTPVRNRKPVQIAMDKVAASAYLDWVAADRPTLWGKMPVITYFLDPDEVPEYRKLIRRACVIVTPDGDAKGVRARFGNEFVLTEKMAEKIGKPEAAGKTVLAWAAIDKRKVSTANGDGDGDTDS